MERTELGQLGEFGLIHHLTKDYKPKQKSTLKGIGDDAAVLDHGNFQTVVSTDILVENLHFDLAYSPLKHIGYKAVVSNLSDIYAMNAIPTQITVSLAISNRFSVEALEELYEGIYEACNRYDVDLVGGDTTSSLKGLFISITAIGKGEKDKLSYRSGARIGDMVCITGDLGGAYLGLQVLEREKMIFKEHPEMQPKLEGDEYIIQRQLKPEARKDIIDLMADAKLVPTSMIDVSDGLASEILHICKESKVGAFIEERNVPIHPEVFQKAIDFNFDPITVALSGGEDYELLFTIDPKDTDKIHFMPNVVIIGEIVDPDDGVKLHTKAGNVHDIIAQGWQHFKPNK